MSRADISKEMVKQAILIRAFFSNRNYVPSETISFVSILLHSDVSTNSQRILQEPVKFSRLVDNFHRFTVQALEQERKDIEDVIHNNSMKVEQLEIIHKTIKRLNDATRIMFSIFHKEEKGTTAVERDIKRQLEIISLEISNLKSASPELHEKMQPAFEKVISSLKTANRNNILLATGNAAGYFDRVYEKIGEYIEVIKGNLKKENHEIKLITKTSDVEQRLITALYNIVGAIPPNGQIDIERLKKAIEDNFSSIIHALDNFIRSNYQLAKDVESEVEKELKVA